MYMTGNRLLLLEATTLTEKSSCRNTAGDLPDQIASYTKLFADDTKIFRAIQSVHDQKVLQEDINKLEEWAQKWKLPFNIEKCKVVHYGKYNPHLNYTMENKEIVTSYDEKDLGVTFDPSLVFSKHIRNIVAKANSRIGIIYHSFDCLDKENLLPLYKSQVRPIVEYCSSVWDPLLKGDMVEIERVQHRATKLVPNLKDKTYPERLRALGLQTLAFRRKRNDILQVFKILKGFDKIGAQKLFNMSDVRVTRGHDMKLSI